jgi:hypothetical protein
LLDEPLPPITLTPLSVSILSHQNWRPGISRPFFIPPIL